MTSDAKIGLLLGLIFIFIIAFVINGLPSLRPPIGKVEATTTTPLVEEDFRGVTGRADEGVPNWVDFVSQQRTDNTPAPPAPAAPVESAPPSPTANHEGVRLIVPLPAIERLLGQLTPPAQNDQVQTINVDTPARAAEPPMASARPPARSEPVSVPAPIEVPRMIAAQEPPRPAPAPRPVIPGSKLYTVVEGDYLGSISNKVYGPEEGNRLVNINRIYEANRDILPSPNAVVVGQKLLIPPLPKPTTVSRPLTPADVLPASHFERPKTTIADKVEALARRAPAAIPAATAEGRWYTVQDGDKLWNIAASQLGAGSRWDEIYKLNTEILTSPESLKPGTRLRLPSK